MEHNVLDGHHYYGISDVAVHRACLVASWTANPGIYQCLEYGRYSSLFPNDVFFWSCNVASMAVDEAIARCELL